MILTKNRNFLLLLFAFALILRVGLFLSFTCHEQHAWIYFDSNQYHAIAQQLVLGNGISSEPGAPNFYRLPGYPIFLSGCYQLFGSSGALALWLQIIIASCIPLLIFLLSLALFPEKITWARCAGIVAALHVGFVLYAGMIATEPLCLFFLLLFFIIFFRSYNQLSPKKLCIAGIMLGMASMMRPFGHYVLFIALIMVIFSRNNYKSKIYSGISMSLGWLLVVTPWLVRNFLLSGYVFFHTLPGIHFLQYSAANIVMLRDGCDYLQARRLVLDEWQQQIVEQEHKEKRCLHEYERCCLGEKLASSYIKKYPLYACKYSCIQIAKTCMALYSSHIILADAKVWPDCGPSVTLWTKMKRFLLPDLQNNFLIAVIYGEIVLFALMLVGILLFLNMLFFEKHLYVMFLKTMPFVGLFIAITLAYGCARLRMPCEPFLILFATAGWLSFFDKRKSI